MKKEKSQKEKSKKEKPFVCTVCKKPATRTVDGEPACEEHAELVYENLVEDYTSTHQKNNDWLKI
jgi:hypothetical protein